MSVNPKAHNHDLTRPRLSADLAGAVSASRSAVAQARGVPSMRLASCVGAVTAELTERSRTGLAPEASVQDVAVAALAAFAAHAARTQLDARGADRDPARRLDEKVRSGRFAAGLRRTWDSYSEVDCAVGESIPELARSCADADKLAWAIIGYEAQRHVRLVWHEAHKLSRHFPDRRPSELVGWGWQGLRIALRNYDPARGFKFSTYACQRIAGAIRDGVRAENPVPKRLTTFLRKVTRVEEELADALGRAPSLEEIAERMGETLDALRILPRLAPTASIDEMTAILSERGGEPAVLIDDADPADMAVDSARRQAINAAIDQLPSEEADAVRLLLYEGLSVSEARDRTGASARQLRARCAKGREHLASVLSEWAPAV